ncbi:hypothetical protein OL548_06285 [Lysinibacillus sp. MHQ-1]|nr:hypothetical protein OL548_06285 [Lysinibacillus sp. MHQ-1]
MHIADGSTVLLDAAYDERFSHDFTGENFKLKNGDSFHVEKNVHRERSKLYSCGNGACRE